MQIVDLQIPPTHVHARRPRCGGERCRHLRIDELGMRERRRSRRCRWTRRAPGDQRHCDKQRAEQNACANRIDAVTQWTSARSSRLAGEVRRSMNRRGTSASMTTRAISGDVADDARHAVETRDLLAVEFLAAVEGDRDAPRVERQLARPPSASNSSTPSPVRADIKSRCRVRHLQPAALVLGEDIDLVVDVDDRHVRRANFFEDATHRSHVPLPLGACRIDHVQRQVRLGHLFERRAKRRDKRVRQSIDETHRVGHQQLARSRQPHLPDERIERHEQRVRRHGLSHSSAG